MNETTSEPTSEATAPNYRIYFKIWAVLLAITLLMVFTKSRAVLLPGMAAKATLIALFYMHLKDERRDFILYVTASIVLLSLILFLLIAPDGMVM
jgi:cytochrome c oxidase subunit IV